MDYNQYLSEFRRRFTWSEKHNAYWGKAKPCGTYGAQSNGLAQWKPAYITPDGTEVQVVNERFNHVLDAIRRSNFLFSQKNQKYPLQSNKPVVN
jgi:hypothetical protein